jgi:FKBP-type peptidyl-prolyl cis-trans isomerase SlyD
MQVAKDKVVSIDYTLKSGEGQVIDTSEGREPLTYLHGGGKIIPGLERQLEGKATGDSLKVAVPPEEGYGPRHQQLVQKVPKETFAGAGVADVQPGMQFRAEASGQSRVVTVVNVEPDGVTIDANHPLAGQTLHFDVTVRDVRDPSDEERQHGHAHGPGGHQH